MSLLSLNKGHLYIFLMFSYAQAAASALKLVLKNFAPVIKSNMCAPPVSMGVDLVREER
jgi:katanin p80 WD40 repeat-containing subunit B1